MKVISAKKFEEQQRRAKYIVLTLFGLSLVGGAFILYNYFQTKSRVAIPKDIRQVEQMIATLKQAGLVESLNVASSELRVNEQQWVEIGNDEKVGIVLQVARYCADRNKTNVLRLKVIGNRTSALLAEFGNSGLRINR